MNPRDPISAVHEAGHAVAALVVGVAVDLMAFTTPPASTWAYCEVTFEMTAPVDRATVFLAGPIAEYLYDDTATAINPESSRIDTAKVRSITRANRWRPAAARAFVRAASTRARNIVARNWDCCQAIAAAFLERRSLTGPEVERLYWRTVNDRSRRRATAGKGA